MEIIEKLRLSLENTGLSENEIGVYLSLLKTGETTTGKILSEYKMSAGKVYIVLDKLIKKGLVSYIIKDNVKYFKAQQPKNIIEYLNRGKKEIQKKEDDIKALLPQLTKSLDFQKDDISVEVYEGLEGFKTATNKMIEEHKRGEIEYQFDNFDTGEKDFLSESMRMYWLEYSKEMIKKKVKAKMLVSSTNKKMIDDVKYLLEGTNSELRFVEGQKFASIFFSKDKTLIMDYGKPSVIFIRNKAIAEGFIKMFEAMWVIGKKV